MGTRRDWPDEAYERLAAAIVEQAVKDYINAVYESSRAALRTWFYEQAGIIVKSDPDYIIERAEKMLKLYEYDGPVYRFDGVYCERWHAYTRAATPGRALSNLGIRFKRSEGFSENAKIKLMETMLKEVTDDTSLVNE